MSAVSEKGGRKTQQQDKRKGKERKGKERKGKERKDQTETEGETNRKDMTSRQSNIQ